MQIGARPGLETGRALPFVLAPAAAQ